MVSTTFLTNDNVNYDGKSKDCLKTYPDKFFSLLGSLNDYDLEKNETFKNVSFLFYTVWVN